MKCYNESVMKTTGMIIKKNKKVLSGLLALTSAITLSGCQSPFKHVYTSSIFAMDTVMELEIEGSEDYTPMAEQMIRDLEKELSVTDENSEVSKLNAKGVSPVSDRAADILKGALDICDRTDGALDISIYPVLKAWGFTTGQYRVPSDEEIEDLLRNVNYKRIQLATKEEARDDPKDYLMLDIDGNEIGKDSGYVAGVAAGMKIDLGSVAKGYTGTYVASRLREEGVTSALLNLGGNVQCIGTKSNGDKWKVAVKSPFDDSKTGMYGVVAADDVAIITSGGYERFFEENGERYWHILDPKTGRPAKSGLASVTIVGKDGLVCDGMSTALFVKGLDEAVKVWKESDDFEAVFITENGEVYVTEGIAGAFSLAPEYADAPLTVIKR